MATDWTTMVSTLKASISITATKTLEALKNVVTDAIDMSWSDKPAFGSGSGQVNEAWQDVRTLAGAATEDLDLAGVLINGRGQTVTFAKIKAIFIKNTSDEQATATDAAMTIGNAAATQFLGPLGAAAHTITLEAGACLFVTAPGAGWTVTAGSVDLFKILNADATDILQYEITLIGTAA
jgi:hypothetical protein